MENQIWALKTVPNREDQVMDFIDSNIKKKSLEVYSLIKAHGMKGYIFLEAKSQEDAQQAFFGVPYAKGLLPKPLEYKEIEHMLEQIKVQANIKERDIVEIISGPFKKEKAKVKRVNLQKEEVIVELLEAAIPIPVTVKLDSIKVIRRDEEEEE